MGALFSPCRKVADKAAKTSVAWFRPENEQDRVLVQRLCETFDALTSSRYGRSSKPGFDAKIKRSYAI